MFVGKCSKGFLSQTALCSFTELVFPLAVLSLLICKCNASFSFSSRDFPGYMPNHGLQDSILCLQRILGGCGSSRDGGNTEVAGIPKALN